MQPMTSDNT